MAANCSLNSSDVTYFNATDLQSIKRSPEDRFFVSILLPAIAICGLFINAAFVYVVYKVPGMRTITNLYLVQLSISDMGTAFFLTFESVHAYLLSPEYNLKQIPGIGCSFYALGIYVFYLSGVNFIFIVTIERYFAICRPMKHRMFRGTSRARDTSIVCWIIGLMMASPLLVPFNEITICAENPDASTAHDTWLVFQTCEPACIWCYYFVITFDTAQFWTVFIINVTIYVAVITKLRKRASNTNLPVSSTTQQVSKDVTLMLIVNGIAFFILLGPCEAWNIAQLINKYAGVSIISTEILPVLFWLSRICTSMNFVINPLIYAGTNRRYRRAFQQVLCCSSSEKNHKADTNGENIKSVSGADTSK
ncbi:somatostatin receptor type 5-like [Amphiura filiformis]|uniref:somatostatin receptor type 5-like n=1 Tax=Amphiura filiformis TaxID=82378 RepID=UPI003B22660C